jgi:DNA transformation protein and related proteins
MASERSSGQSEDIMAVSLEFREFVEELLATFGPVAIKPMFGGAGVYADGINFGLIAEDTLYLKVDDGNRAAFEAEGMSPFVYAARGKPVAMSYWQVPDRLLDDADDMAVWARDALAAARRAKRR